MEHARRHAACGTARGGFDDIKRNTAGISQQMLTRTLRGLERDGIVTRRILPTRPPRVEYSLTEARPLVVGTGAGARRMGTRPSHAIRRRPSPVRCARWKGPSDRPDCEIRF